MICGETADREHRKVQATVARCLEFFKRGQKSLVFCVFTKTAETIRDELNHAVDAYLHEVRDRVFKGEDSFDNFRRRFFNRREPLFSLIQDQPLLGKRGDGNPGVPDKLLLGETELNEVARILTEFGHDPDDPKPDRRLLLAAAEHVAARNWNDHSEGRTWLNEVFKACPTLASKLLDRLWLQGREPLSRAAHADSSSPMSTEADDPARGDPLDYEDEAVGSMIPAVARRRHDAPEAWTRRLREDTLGQVIAPYFRRDVVRAHLASPPLLARHHTELLSQLDGDSRPVAGQVFRRILMAEEFLLRYLANVPRETSEHWADYLAERYDARSLDGHNESLKDRVNAYLETLVRAQKNPLLFDGYKKAAMNRNVVQLVDGSTQDRDRHFLGFNTPYRPEILVATSVGQEGIDLHRECRHVIHHDLCWNPATIEQRTGRVDRIGSKVERERVGIDDEGGPALEVVVPYLAATYDERMFEELYRRGSIIRGDHGWRRPRRREDRPGRRSRGAAPEAPGGDRGRR